MIQAMVVSPGEQTNIATITHSDQYDPAPTSNTDGVVVISPSPEVTPSAPPSVTSLQRFGFHAQPTEFVLTFSSALDPLRAQDPHNYKLKPVGPHGHVVGKIRIVVAVYNPFAHTVTLHPATRLYLFQRYKLVVNGMPPSGLAGPSGILLDGLGQRDSGQRLRQELRPRDPGGSISANLVTDEPPDPTRDIGPHAFLDDAFTITSGCIGANDRAHPASFAECRTPPAAAGYRGRSTRNVGFSPQESASRSKRKQPSGLISLLTHLDSRRATRVNWRAFTDISRLRRSFEPSWRVSSGATVAAPVTSNGSRFARFGPTPTHATSCKNCSTLPRQGHLSAPGGNIVWLLGTHQFQNALGPPERFR